jgi:uncharacterized membrane protein
LKNSSLLEQWLRRLRWSLSRLAAHDREEIVREARSHIEERVAAGHALDTVLADFGPAERYAHQFVDEIEAYAALGSQRTGDLARFITSRSHRNVIAAATLLALLVFAVIAASVIFMLVLKILDPVHTGVWVGANFTLIGVIDDPSTGRDLLGLWMFPLAALLSLLVWVVGRRLLFIAVPLLMPRATDFRERTQP